MASTILNDLDGLLATSAEKILLSTGIDRSVALDDLGAYVRLRALVREDPGLAARFAGGPDGLRDMGQWFREASTEMLSRVRPIDIGGPGHRPRTIHDYNDEDRAFLTTGAQPQRPVELRDMSSTALAGLVPPEYLWDLWAPTVGVRTAVDALATVIDLGPDAPVSVVLPVVGTSATAAAQSAQNAAAASESDPTVVDQTSTSSVATILANPIDVSRQAWERQAGTVEANGREITTAMRRTQSRQFLFGTGGSGELRGLANISGITAVTVSATTAAGQILALLNTAQQVATAAGVGLEQLVVCAHPRRLAFWLSAGSASREAGGATYVAGLRCVSDPSVRTTISGGQDEVFVTWPGAVQWLETGPDAFTWEQNSTSAPAIVRVTSYARVGLVVRPLLAVGRMSGAGLVGPTW